ncbi:MAG: hypothetical protein J6Q69_01265 [Clostridia bacterium]|nr:hypothetical protein [Clostridia bacterium]
MTRATNTYTPPYGSALHTSFGTE